MGYEEEVSVEVDRELLRFRISQTSTPELLADARGLAQHLLDSHHHASCYLVETLCNRLEDSGC